MDTVETVAVGQVRGDLGLRVDPCAELLLVCDEDRHGEHGEIHTETDGGNRRVRGLEPGGRAEVGARDVGGGHELLHHIRARGGDVEGEGQRTGGHLGGDEVTLLVEDLIGGDILTLPGSGVLDNLTQGLRAREVGELRRGIVSDGGEDDEVALSYKRDSCGIDFADNSCHVL